MSKINVQEGNMKRFGLLWLCIILLLGSSQALAQTDTVVMKAPPGISEIVTGGTAFYPDAHGNVAVPVVYVQACQSVGFRFYDQYILQQALAGDLVFVVSPGELTTAHGSAANRTVTVTLQDAAGETHTWFNDVVASGVSIAKSSSAGTATIASTTLTFVAGVATVAITEGGTWAAADTDTLTVAPETLFGGTVYGPTSTETMN